MRLHGGTSSEVTRSFDGEAFNALLNDPEVKRWITVPGIETIDLAPFVAETLNVLLTTEGGAIFFAWDEPGIYHVHTNFLKPYRGRHALRASLNAYRWMFTHTDCMALLTQVPAFNKGADWFCKMVGATKEFERKDAWPTEGAPADISYWSLRYDAWVRQTPDLIESGRAFHVKLEEEFARHGRTEDNHPDDEAHDRHVGACFETVYGGQPEKAIALYNRWARFAGYGQIGLASSAPVVIDIGSALLQVTGDTFKAILVR